MSDYSSSFPSSGAPATTLNAFFDSRTDAEEAIEQLRAVGVSDSSVRLTGSEATGASARQEPKGFFEALSDLFMPDDDRHTYAEGLSRGGYLVTVTDVPPELRERALDVLDAEGTVNLDEREEAWRSEGWTGYDAGGAGAGYVGGAGATATGAFAEGRAEFEQRDDATLPVVEEQLRVGKRDVSHGRVRVRSYVRETPVNEQVNVTDEHVEIERRPVDRAVGVGDDAFRERSIEAEEHGEEVVVSKEARVVEEIGLRRESETHSETVSDTVRHTEVEVEDDRYTTGVRPDPDRR
jgi:uncharacterized protein (TIGR02271 family)